MMESLFGGRNALTFPPDLRLTIDDAVSAPEVRELFRDEPPTTWALDPRTIDLLWKRLEHDRPQAVIECGAGTSTLLLAKHASLTSVEAPFVISLEQDAAYARDVEGRLARQGLERYASIVHAPLDEQARYIIDPSRIESALGDRRAKWIVVDGPSGPEGCRAHTLPMLARFCAPGARWFLDDAFRDGEIETLKEWAAMRGIRVEGIYPVGHGLATGIILDPERVGSA